MRSVGKKPGNDESIENEADGTHGAQEELEDVDDELMCRICDPVDELVDQIRTMTSGIVVPDKKVIG